MDNPPPLQEEKQSFFFLQGLPFMEKGEPFYFSKKRL